MALLRRLPTLRRLPPGGVITQNSVKGDLRHFLPGTTKYQAAISAGYCVVFQGVAHTSTNNSHGTVASMASSANALSGAAAANPGAMDVALDGGATHWR